MGDIQNLEFRFMQPGQGEEVSNLVLKAVDLTNEERFTPDGRAAFQRYAAPLALESRQKLGYIQELVYVSGVLAGVLETKGWAHISMLYIHPDYVNKGLGSRLVVRAAARCTENMPKSKYLYVYATDDALDFYERIGFSRSGSRQILSGFPSTPYRLPLESHRNNIPSKLRAQQVKIFVFTGTGNTLLVSQNITEVLRQEGLIVSLHGMEEPCSPVLDAETALGLAFPVACFSTYPTVWRFIHSLPPGEGREVFMIGTMGGFSGGMQGPLRRVLVRKGYQPIAAKFFVMPGNYNRKSNDDSLNARHENDARRLQKALLEARLFAYDLLKGRTKWSSGIPLLSSFFYKAAQTRYPWNLFYKMFPITVDEKKCVRCKRCVDNCPEKAMRMGKYPAVEALLCQSCQRCVGFCPKGALHVPGKSAEPYRALSFEEYKSALK